MLCVRSKWERYLLRADPEYHDKPHFEDQTPIEFLFWKDSCVVQGQSSAKAVPNKVYWALPFDSKGKCNTLIVVQTSLAPAGVHGFNVTCYIARPHIWSFGNHIRHGLHSFKYPWLNYDDIDFQALLRWTASDASFWRRQRTRSIDTCTDEVCPSVRKALSDLLSHPQNIMIAWEAGMKNDCSFPCTKWVTTWMTPCSQLGILASILISHTTSLGQL